LSSMRLRRVSSSSAAISSTVLEDMLMMLPLSKMSSRPWRRCRSTTWVRTLLVKVLQVSWEEKRVSENFQRTRSNGLPHTS
jgi:hypothetical protein